MGFQGSEIELFNDDQDSKFDRYMDDIIYAIHESGSDVIVFEDLDRFNMLSAFVKLRRVKRFSKRNKKARKTKVYKPQGTKTRRQISASW